jgi:hypothetical protein
MALKTFITYFLFLLLLLPATPVFPQKTEEDPAETELMQTTTESSADKKTEKKKKNVVALDERFFISLAIDLTAILLIMIFIYYPNYKKMECVFTFIIFNLIIFMLTFVLKYVKLSVGTAFGMFAVFSMLRYRTEGLSIRDMTYLFICIALGLMSAIQLEYYKLLVIHSVILAGTIILDGNLFFRRELCKSITYENMDLIGPGKKEELMKDLKERTGLNIHRISMNKIDFIRDSATIKVYYYDQA